MHSKDLKPWNRAMSINPLFNRDNQIKQNLYFHKAGDKWVMADDKSHQYKIDIFFTTSYKTAVILQSKGLVNITHIKNDKVYMETKHIY